MSGTPTTDLSAPTRDAGLPGWVWVLALVAAGGVGYLGRGLFVPLLIASIGAYFLNPLVLRLEARGAARTKAVALLFSAFLLVLAGTIVLGLPTLRAKGQEVMEEAPVFAEKIETALDTIAADLRAQWPVVAQFLPAEGRPGWSRVVIEEQSDDISTVAGEAGAMLFFLILSPVFAFFMLRDGPRLVDWVVARIDPRHIETSVAVWAEIDGIVGRYLRGLVLESLGVGLLVGLGLWFLQIPFPWVLAAFATVVNPLPYIGALMSLALASLVALAAQLGYPTIGALVALFVVIRLIDDLVLIPFTIGGSVHLHPMLVILSILVGEHALGVLGMVLAVPTVTVVKEIVRLLLEHHRTLSRRAGPLLVREHTGHVVL